MDAFDWSLRASALRNQPRTRAEQQFVELSSQEFGSYVKKYSYGNFLQTVEMGKLRKVRGWQIYYLGVKADGDIILGALLASIKMRTGHYFEITGGLIGDYTNLPMVTFFTHSLVDFCKKRKGIYLALTPDIVNRIDSKNLANCQKLENALITENNLISVGFKKFDSGDNPFPFGFPKYSYIKDLSEITLDNLKHSYTHNGKYFIKKANNAGITTRRLSYEELEKFHKITTETAKRCDFEDKSLDYYQKFYRCFEDSAIFLMASINFDTYLNNLILEDTQVKKNNLIIKDKLRKNEQSNKIQTRLKENQKQLEVVKQRIITAKQYLEKYGSGEIDISCGLFIFLPQEAVYFSSGTLDDFRQFYAPYLIQDEMIKESLKRGIKRYNFYGLLGKFDGTDGILKFKSHFNGYIEEKIGGYTLVISPVRYLILRLVSKISTLLKLS
ncbi:peptidoglycan bridge formation glycyltransferase FemA/FemB family protein [Enterococcus sp. MMGLQ5-2]|nr:peptidoglycan bridge formation glycyltransferase FemA/FemB family protein [Enterococcus sp. MMGLQ5-2]MBS7576516.1 peptidoglycan bridge formation glycyltransferase FemA/FemB family protein [Enterococcus sp. MMGLQ5-2]NPD36353.1 peptidoglycan bridge formation glycyltransferase FemA/FemB family protein [Enterococcus sp. MMGLQ5-2]